MQFDFGKNWLDYSKQALNVDKIQQAKEHFEQLFQHIDLKNKFFLDIGFGQGLSLLIAKEKGAIVIGNEINPTCEEALKQTATHFPTIQLTEIPLVMGSILEQNILEKLTKYSNNEPGFDIVHSWGVLHHTGNMRQALQNAATLVKPNGYLVISIYNRHWTSPIWLVIKWLYCHSPKLLQTFLIYSFYPVIWLAKYLFIRQNPTQMTRGMNFFYNVIDWIGGYPYEYASLDEIEKLLEKLGFSLVKKIQAQVPTGCNEFIFQKQKE
jgi:2-polyprenyl-6-hydroxyphenyl methylase/3-demethylubiquinone-9 3-methyltransferase